MKKSIRIMLAVFILLASVAYVYLTGPVTMVGKSIVYSNYETIELGKGDKLQQTFVLDESKPMFIVVPFTNESHLKKMEMEYILEKKGQPVEKGLIDFSSWSGNSTVRESPFKSGYVIPIPHSKPGTYLLKLEVIKAEEEAKASLRTGTALPADNVLSINGEKNSKSLAIKAMYSEIYWSKIIKAAFSALGALLVLFLIGQNSVRNFVTVASVMGFLFIFNNPIFEATDEIFHFSKSYDISLGNMLSTKQGNQVGVNLPRNIEDMPRPSQVEITYGMLAGDEVYDKAKSEAWDIYRFSDETKFVEQPTTAVYTPIPYIPQAIGLFIARVLGLKAFYAIALGRLLNLAAYVALTAVALRLVPRLKSTLAFLACFPLFVSLAASFSADSILMGLNYLFISLIMRLLFTQKQESLTMKEFVLPTFILLLIVLCKFTYWPLSFLLLAFWGRALFKTKLQGILAFLFVAGLPAVMIAAWNIFIMGFVGTISANEKVNPTEQLHFILNRPAEFIKTLFNTFEWGSSAWVLMANQVGWVTHLLSGIVVISLAGLLITAIFDHVKDEWRLRPFDYFVFALTIAGITGLVMVSLYLTWTEVGSNFISGLQGRYFLPVIPIILFMFNERMNVQKNSEQTALKSARLACAMLLYANLFMIGHFY
ncbi:MAG: DUF2142 domain-containing protein [Ectobacillus sp.]